MSDAKQSKHIPIGPDAVQAMVELVLEAQAQGARTTGVCTGCLAELLIQLIGAGQFMERLLDPEDLGLAVSEEVRDGARVWLGLNRVKTTKH